ESGRESGEWRRTRRGMQWGVAGLRLRKRVAVVLAERRRRM
ncbi:MAG: hypothetical protein RL486_1340, partial [Actinomycetota bacterium]